MKQQAWLCESLGEVVGTFILVFFGTGVVHAAVLTQSQSGLWQVAVVWGAAVGLAIYAVAAVSGAHINPAITVAFALKRTFPLRKVPRYLASQLLGAILAAGLLYVIFSGPIRAFEKSNSIVRGQAGSELSAMVYGEYFPNPAVARDMSWPQDCVSQTVAFFAEVTGTGLLAFFVFALTDKRNSTPKGAQAILIGLVIAGLISVIAPLTQACFNPARDFGPRLVAYMAGWKAIAIPGPRGGFFTVYILAPIVGAAGGAYAYEALIGLGLRRQIEGDSMKRVKLLFAGGFLGAGKTTLLYRAARELIKSGKRVGLVTNDQAPDLVDTQMLSSHGLTVSEVAGSCFCCNFKGLLDAARSLCGKPDSVDVLLAEPVGSCTDLSATIIQPIKDRYADLFSVGPLSVLLDPARAMEILGNDKSQLHPSAAYIYRKQIEEADRIVVNKSDLLDSETREQLKTLLSRQFPGRDISFISCRSGDGVERWLSEVINTGESGRWILDIDYDTYAEGEAVLGWLNARFGLRAKEDFDWPAFARGYLEAIRDRLRSVNAQVGHIKLFLSTTDGSLTANLTATDGAVLIQQSAESLQVSRTADMTFNARVEMDPDRLQQITLDMLHDYSGDLSVQTYGTSSLRPGRPQPTFRYAEKI
ncbi:MAG: MIP family channel protein [Sedimentisphaerales bacterium]|nr:MIP family channel protein [Sedimentisphaerales bacterium]